MVFMKTADENVFINTMLTDIQGNFEQVYFIIDSEKMK